MFTLNMSKLTCVILLCAVAAAFAAMEDVTKTEELILHEDLQTDDIQGSPRRLEGTITNMVECIRRKIKKGIPIIGSLDPLTLKILPLPQWNNILSGFMLLTNFKLEGLADFDQTKGSLVLNTVEFGLKFDKIQLTTKYRGRMTLFRYIEVYGSGTLSIAFNNIDIDTAVKVAPWNLLKPIKELFLNITLPTTDAKITGLFNDELLSDIISRQLSDTLNTLAIEEHEKFNTMVNTFLWSRIKDLSMQDIWKMKANSAGKCDSASAKIEDFTKVIVNHIDSISLDDYEQYETDA